MSDNKNAPSTGDEEDTSTAPDVSLAVVSKKAPRGKGRFLVLCGHPPHTDPRILFMADTLARLGEVTIVASSDYGGKDEGAVVYKRHSCRSFRSAKGRGVFSILRAYWPWFNPRNSSLFFKIIIFGLKRMFGLQMGHLRDLTLGFLPYYARNLTHKSFDYIVCCDAYMMEAAIEAKKLQEKAKLIFDAHEVFYSEFNQTTERELQLRKVEQGWLKHTDRLFVVSKGIQALYLKRNPNMRGRVHCLANSIPFCGVKKEQIVANTDGVVRFLFQGGYSSFRGIDRLLEIWSELPACNASLTLRMVGYTPDKLASLKSIVARGGVGNEVVFAEPVKEDDLVSACVGFDVGVIPYLPEISLSHLNCCPNKFGQYMNSGCALLTTNSRYLRRLVKDMDCGWSYDANNVKAAAELITRIVADRRALHEKRLSALHHAEHTYNWDIMDRVVESATKQ